MEIAYLILMMVALLGWFQAIARQSVSLQKHKLLEKKVDANPINMFAILVEVPILVCFIYLKVTLIGQWWRLLECVGSIGKGDNQTVHRREGQEHTLAWLVDT